MSIEEAERILAEIFAVYLEGDILAELVFDEIYEVVEQSLTGATRDEILEIAERNSAALIDNIVNGTKEGLQVVIKDALEKQIGVNGLKKELLDYIGLNSKQIIDAQNYKESLIQAGLSEEEIRNKMDAYTSSKLKERAETIARTEMRRAVSEGEEVVMAARGAQYKVWITTGDDAVSDECQANEAQGPIPIDEDFVSGGHVPPQHPNCRCSVTFITSEEQKARASKRSEERAKNTAKAKE